MAAGLIKLLDAACMAALAMASAVARVIVDVDRIMMPTNGSDGAINPKRTTLYRVPTAFVCFPSAQYESILRENYIDPT